MEEVDINTSALGKSLVYSPKSSCRISYKREGDGAAFNAVKINSAGINYEAANVVLSQDIKLNGNLASAEDGIYCYVVYPTNQIAFVKVKTAAEMGTTHNAIVYKLKINHISFAGEFKKVGPQVQYNFLSGTYLQYFNSNNSRKNRINTINNARRALMEDLLSKYDCKGEYVPKTFITGKVLPLTSEEIERLKKVGVKFYGFKSLKDCTTSKKSLQEWIERYSVAKDAKTIAQVEGWKADLERISREEVLLGGKAKSSRKKAPSKNKKTLSSNKKKGVKQ